MSDILLQFSQILENIKDKKDYYNDTRKLEFDSFFLLEDECNESENFVNLNIQELKIYVLDPISKEKIFYDEKDYTLYSLNNKILVCFHKYRKFLPKTYLYIDINNKTIIVQSRMFEDVQKFFHMGKDHSWGSFVFFGSKVIEQKDPTVERCDFSDYGPVIWNEVGQARQIGYDESFGHTLYITDIAEFSTIMSVPNSGHIMFIRLKPVNGKVFGQEYNNQSTLPFISMTLFELLKLIYEWASVAEEPWNNNQEIAIKSKQFLEALDISSIFNSIKENQTNMQVYRYLSGLENARERPPLEEVSLMPDDVYGWFKKQFCYQKFENLLLYHPFLNN